MNNVKFKVANVEVSEEEIINYVKNNFWPGSIFNEKELSAWAESNGYVKRSDL